MSAIDVSHLPSIAAREWLGGTVLAADDESGAARLRYVPGLHLRNPAGTLFGGFIAAMVDDAAGLATWFGGGQRAFATANLSVNLLHASRTGDAIVADVVLTAVGSRQAFVDVRLSRESDGTLIATGAVVQSFLSPYPTVGR